MSRKQLLLSRDHKESNDLKKIYITIITLRKQEERSNVLYTLYITQAHILYTEKSLQEVSV